VELDLLERLCQEYLDLPGLQLTAAQVARLLDTNLENSLEVLQELTACSFLRRQDSVYVRAE
jgi:hypothetical protein